MSIVPATIRTTPAQRSWPSAVNTAATNVSATPITVIWFGVKGMRPSADINASARRRTQSSNRVVNIQLLDLAGGGARLLVNLDDLRGDYLPPKATSLLVPVRAQGAAARR